MNDVIEEVIEEIRKTLKPVFEAKSLDDITGKSIRWRSVQNERSRGEIPESCFLYCGRKVLIRRDPFLDWWRNKLSSKRVVR